MRQRVLQATIVTVMLAVLMLGIPLGFSWLRIVETNLNEQVRNINTQVLTDVDRAITNGRPIDRTMLQRYVDNEQDLSIYVEVTYGDNVMSAGNPSGDNPVTTTGLGTQGERVKVSVPRSDVNGHVASAWVLIIVAGLSAISVGVSVALWQAQRLSAPLSMLTRRAEELGSGRARDSWTPSGVVEIDTVADELAKAGAQLAERLAAESALASDASHQLRTPLTALSMRLDEILATSSEEWVREEARIALEQIDRLTTVVHDLINAPRSSQRRTPGVVELNSVLTQQSEEWSPAFKAARRELRVQVPHSAAVWASVGPLTQVIATLIENSLVHGDGRTLVKVRRNERSTVVEVSDEGAGIEPGLGKRIFERSVSGRSSSGTGVGLALAKTLVEDDGGRLELLTERPATFGVFLISAPDDDHSDGMDDEILGTSPGSLAPEDLPARGRVSPRKSRGGAGSRGNNAGSDKSGAHSGRDHSQ
ncbi:ATP-binding protein [Devriesea agamarum]|uniref:ATP-binding protein n=1 Tax=Devriesea agamarum TaxID=472569 RepID=UPI000A06D497|nr:ATP-binding protein [Devriesea agamarum]